MKRIANIVLNNFTHDSRVFKTSQTLASIGYDVTVVALHDEGLLEKELKENFKIHRIRLLSRNWSKFKAVQVLKYLEFIYRSVILYRRHDYLHCNDLSGLIVGVLIKLFGARNKIIYDSHEFAINDRPNQSKISIKSKKLLESTLIRFADNVIVVSNSIAEEYSRIYKIRKPAVVLNCPEFKNQTKNNIFRDIFDIKSAQKIFLYQGALSPGRGIEIILEAFSARLDNSCVLVCMGYGSLEKIIQEKAKQSDNIFYHPAVNPNVLLDYTSSADFGIAFIEDTCLSYRYCLPNKLFEYLMAGLPILASNLPELRHIVETESIGIVAETNSVRGFKNALEMVCHMDSSAMLSNVNSASRKYCWQEQEIVLLKIYS